jgi:SNF2 family DNA or RNA helicase
MSTFKPTRGIEQYLDTAQISYAGLRGSMLLKKRAAMLARFQDDASWRPNSLKKMIRP